MDNQHEGNRIQYDGPRNVLPHSITNSSREAQKKYMEATEKKKTTPKPPVSFAFRQTVACEDNTTKYIFKYITKGTHMNR
uniref:Uncharacterized protein n=2 Tax=Aegilops tauschii TaxID=37682 RepID=A0A453RSK7_AEGTS